MEPTQEADPQSSSIFSGLILLLILLIVLAVFLVVRSTTQKPSGKSLEWAQALEKLQSGEQPAALSEEEKKQVEQALTKGADASPLSNEERNQILNLLKNN